MMGNRAEYLYDVASPGLRLLEHREKLTQARVIICVPEWKARFQRRRRPRSRAGHRRSHNVGYGASFGGVAALLGMLNSCPPTSPSSTSTTFRRRLRRVLHQSPLMPLRIHGFNRTS